jgi:molecular chaperone GrpE
MRLALLDYINPREFAVDEQPLPIWQEDVGATAQGQDVEPGASQDLLTQMQHLLLEQVRLAERAKFLEKNKGNDDEFGRFARQALPFLDNFHRLLELARENPPSDEVMQWLKNVEALYFRIVSLLENFGVVFINSAGKPVDLNYHEVVEVRRSDEYPPDTVIKELQKGVVFRGRLLRDAKVIVSH